MHLQHKQQLRWTMVSTNITGSRNVNRLNWFFFEWTGTRCTTHAHQRSQRLRRRCDPMPILQSTVCRTQPGATLLASFSPLRASFSKQPGMSNSSEGTPPPNRRTSHHRLPGLSFQLWKYTENWCSKRGLSLAVSECGRMSCRSEDAGSSNRPQTMNTQSNCMACLNQAQ